MNVKQIKQRALLMSRQHYKSLLPSFYLINCGWMVIQYLSSGLLVLISELVLVTIVHGFIYMALLLVNQQQSEFKMKEIFIGITQFPKYFPSYIVRKVAILVPSLIFFLPALSMLTQVHHIAFYDLLDQFVYLFFSRLITYDLESIILISKMSLPIIILLIFGIIIASYISILLVLVPCIVEDYDYAWNEALVKSVRMMNNHVGDFIRLIISLSPRYIMHVISSFVLVILCSKINEIGMSLYLLLSMLSLIFFWQIPYYISVAIFYLEIRNEEITRYPHELFKI